MKRQSKERGEDMQGRGADVKKRSGKKQGENRNLLILGIFAVGVALVTTAISIVIYHRSGDIYLDRSRPGFLPDEKEVEEEAERKDYSFSETTELDAENLDEYLEHYKESLEDLDKIEKPFAEDPLTDKSLGIPEGE